MCLGDRCSCPSLWPFESWQSPYYKYNKWNQHVPVPAVHSDRWLDSVGSKNYFPYKWLFSPYIWHLCLEIDILFPSLYQLNQVAIVAITINFVYISLPSISNTSVCFPSVSHFCIGQVHLGQLRLTTFLYCKPTPYLARVDTGIYKCMRWNVDRLRDEQQADVEQGGESETETVGDTELWVWMTFPPSISSSLIVDQRDENMFHPVYSWFTISVTSCAAKIFPSQRLMRKSKMSLTVA